jgi:ADP-ribosylglycohydrolase
LVAIFWPGQSFDAFNKNVLGPTSKIALKAIRDGKPVAELEITA